MNQKLIFDLDFSDLQEWVKTQGEPGYRASQIWEGLYKHCSSCFSDITNLSQTFRERLENNFQFSGLSPLTEIMSDNGDTHKTLFELQDGSKIETVLMRYRNRLTVCLSTQAGCAMGCTFCATGQMGFSRNLTSGEIISQVLHYERKLRVQSETLTNVVLMGMGEPFNNYESCLKALNTLNDPNGFGMGARRFTISTVGIIPKIRQFADENLQYNLAVSLHAANDELRSSLVPINRIYPLTSLIEACKYYVNTTHRRITFEYALIEGVNDSIQHARALVNLLRGILCHVNIISLNPTPDYEFHGSKEIQIKAFLEILSEKKISNTLRSRRGIEIQAGCGQLANQQSTML
ncbi:MAG: 23S rRNA (adenine(2503)-C(2))-methyltransferase RlmN [Anaerolineaceae bacterium]|nr:23S rRNA (adenine(2503)-C(2))-methyltransferase RlmN [Anaerolineaceae bacterium]